MKNKIETGTIIQIPLEHNLGYVSAKLINLNELIENPIYNELLYVYNDVFENTELFNSQNIETKDLLLGPVFILDLPPILRKRKWKIIGYIKPTKNELTIPDFKDFGPITAIYENDAKVWYGIKQLDLNNRIPLDYHQVMHLEKFVFYSHDIVSRRITMEVIRQQNRKIEDFYSLQEWREIAPYNNMMFTPVYSTIPHNKRGKLLL